MKIKSVVSIIVLGAVTLAFFSGCAGGLQWKIEPEMATVDNDQFTAQLKPVCSNSRGGGCRSFDLSIVNKTDRDIEVNWNKTLYISGGQTAGGFMFVGIVFKDRNNPKPPDMVFAKGTLTKEIWPNNLVYYKSSQPSGWKHGRMPQGENGVYLSLIIDGKEVSERLLVRLSAVPIT